MLVVALLPGQHPFVLTVLTSALLKANFWPDCYIALQVAERAAGNAGCTGGSGGSSAYSGATWGCFHIRSCAVIRSQHYHAHLHDGALYTFLAV